MVTHSLQLHRSAIGKIALVPLITSFCCPHSSQRVGVSPAVSVETMLSAALCLCIMFSQPGHLKPACILQQPGVSGYVQEADILLGGIFPLHLDPGKPPETFTEPPRAHACQRFSFRSFRWFLVLLFAVNEINRTPGMLPNLTLGAAVMDSCSDAKGALRGASWLLSGGPGGLMSYKCWGPPPRMSAVLGDAGEQSALSLANVFGLYKYPQISYFTPPAKLSNHILYPSTLSVAPTVSSQAKGIVRLLQKFGWSWVGVLSQETSASTLSQAFLEELVASGACLAFWEKVPSGATEVMQVTTVIRRSTANVVVVFSLEAYINPVLVELARNGDTRDRLWLSTDAWSTSPGLVAPWFSHFLRGSLGLTLRNGAAPGFKEFVFGLHPNEYNNHPFFKEFWEKAFNCHWSSEENHSSLFVPLSSTNSPTTSIPLDIAPTFDTVSVSSSVSFSSSFSASILLPITLPTPSSTNTLCTGLEDPASLQIFSDIGDLRVTYNVYKAVRMVAKALQDMGTCSEEKRALVGHQCIDMQQFKPWQLFYYLRRVQVKGNIGDDLYFDSLGNAPAVYDIINWQEESEGDKWVRVGSYESGAPLGQDLFINHSAIRWGEHFGQVPSSVCSENCPQGFWKAPRLGQAHCCFDCIPCATREISNRTDAADCFLCPDEEQPNSAHNQCLPSVVEFLSMSEPLGLSLGTASILGSILPAAVLFLFIKNRETPLVRANNCALSFILLVALSLSFLCPLLLLVPPGNYICLIRQAAFGVLFTLCISCLLAKTIIVLLAFHANQPGGCLRDVMGLRWPIFFAIFCTTIQLTLCLFWFSLDPPFPKRDAKSQLGKIIVQCNEGLGFWFMLGYLGLLSSVCFVIAFLARKLPGAFNEATHITFSMLVFLSVWISFIPAYLSTHGMLAVATEIFAILSSSACLLFCIFSPKVYIILLKPQLNTRAMISGQQRRQTAITQSVSPPQGRRYSRTHR